jgi:flagellar biosynthesis/type III secretory pathway ATPase
VDKAIVIYEDLINLLRQQIEESFTIDELFDRMLEIARKAEKATDPNFR